MTRSQSLAGLLCAAVLGLAVFPWFAGEFYIGLMIRIMILGIFAMSLDFLVGYTGLISFGHAAFFGLTGYILAIVTPESGPVTLWYALFMCLSGSAIAALAIGWVSVRTSGIYFIMITLAISQMFYYYFNESVELGSSDGIFIFHRPIVALGELTLIDLGDEFTLYYFVLVSLAGSYLALMMVLGSPFGKVIQGVRVNEARTRALGFATQRYKLVSFVISGTLAGYAGFLEATHTGFVSPATLGWHESGTILMIVILGGIGTLYGPVLGAFVMVFLQDKLQEFSELWLLMMGFFVVAVVLFLPHGIAGLIARLAGARPANGAEETGQDRKPAVPAKAGGAADGGGAE
ncbi:MAG TPA: branched-chain amino acid ABC transporter permease [Kiloniellales bacterium]|jgi:branched-chain amino acid transport system permease protein